MTKRTALLTLLSDGAWHPDTELLVHGGLRYGGRLHELRGQGAVIERRMSRCGHQAYRLVRPPDPPRSQERWFDFAEAAM